MTESYRFVCRDIFTLAAIFFFAQLVAEPLDAHVLQQQQAMTGSGVSGAKQPIRRRRVASAAPGAPGVKAQPQGAAISGGKVGSCPFSSQSLTLNLAGIVPTDIPGVPQPAADNYFLEGPVWMGTSLYMSQIRDYGTPYPPSQILKYTPGGGFVELRKDAGTNGLALDQTGKLIGASHSVGGLVAIDPSGATPPTAITASFGGSRLNSPNDLTFRSDGTSFFTDPTWQCGSSCTQATEGVYRVPPGGAPELLTVLQSKPNGIALSLDEKTLYVGGDFLASYPIKADGSVGPGFKFGSGAADGLAIDCAGNIYAAGQSGSVGIYDAAGTSIGSIPANGCTNVAFGGPSRTTLYITGMNPGSLKSVELNIPGK